MVALSLIGVATPGFAQTPPESLPEDVQPRVIGQRGTMMVGISGYVDSFFSRERLYPTHYTAHVDVSRFVFRKMVVRGGLSGSGTVRDEESDGATGSGAPALHAFGGVLYYFTPQSILTLYSGAEYWAQLTRRAEADAGSVVGKLGIEGAMSSRVNLFVEGGYGVGLTKGDRGETLSRFVGQLGVRLKW